MDSNGTSENSDRCIPMCFLDRGTCGASVSGQAAASRTSAASLPEAGT